MQLTVMSLLVFRLTGESTSVSISIGLQFLPMLFLGAWAGSIADALDKRKMAIVTQSAMAAMNEGRELTLAERSRNRRDHAYVVRLCRQAVDRLFTAMGGQGIFLDNVAQRKFRDIHAMSGHLALNWDIAGTTYGRVALGLEPQARLI